jgi:dienelactone hydrolase
MKLVNSILGVGVALIMGATAASADMVSGDYEYQVDGVTYQGYVARNTNIPQSRGTVLIVHDWDGVTDYEKQRAEMLAAYGYTAFAVDVYGKETRPTNFEENRAFSGALYADRAEFRKRLLGSLKAVSGIEGAPSTVTAMGYCFGGAAVLEMARAGMEVEGYVSFHGGLGLPEGQSYADAKAPVLVLHGSADPVSGMADLAALMDQLQGNGVTHSAKVFGGARHSFTVFGSRDYDLVADRGSWDALLDFLSEELG